MGARRYTEEQFEADQKARQAREAREAQDRRERLGKAEAEAEAAWKAAGKPGRFEAFEEDFARARAEATAQQAVDAGTRARAAQRERTRL